MWIHNSLTNYDFILSSIRGQTIKNWRQFEAFLSEFEFFINGWVVFTRHKSNERHCSTQRHGSDKTNFRCFITHFLLFAWDSVLAEKPGSLNWSHFIHRNTCVLLHVSRVTHFIYFHPTSNAYLDIAGRFWIEVNNF